MRYARFMSREKALRHALQDALGHDPGPLRLAPTGGGCINTASVIEASGQKWFVKWNDRPLEGQFEAEAAGLRALAASGTSLRIPEVLCFSDEGPGRSFLVVEHLPPGRRASDFDERLGRGLAELHRCGNEKGFGFDIDGCCGATPQPNGWMDDWIAFYAERRLGHQVQLARRRGMGSSDLNLFDKLIKRLPALLDPGEPALIHGDLWSGNLHVAPDGLPSLIDPAAYWGHREAELGMMVLFGGFSSRVFDAYDEAWPLASGWRERLDLYALYHVLNHYNLFGGGYGSQAVSLARRYL